MRVAYKSRIAAKIVLLLTFVGIVFWFLRGLFYSSLLRRPTLKNGFEWTAAQLGPADLEQAFHQRISRVQVTCPKIVRVGENYDGGWDTCMVGPFTIQQPCLVYGFGLGGRGCWSFELSIAEKYLCEEMAYDPYADLTVHNVSNLMRLHPVGLGGKNEGPLKTLATLLQENGHTESTIDILKIDVELAEWKSLETSLKDGSLLNVKQLMLEIHTHETKLRQVSSDEDYTFYLQVLDGLELLGFRIWQVEPNMQGINPFKSRVGEYTFTCCYNVYFVNIKYIL